MNEIDKMMLEIDEKIAEANRQKEDIARQQKAVNASLKELAAAKKHVEKAQAVVNGDAVVIEAAPKKETAHVVTSEATTNEPATKVFVGKHEVPTKETVVITEPERVVVKDDKKDNTSVGFLTGFATCGIIAILAAGAWILTRDGKTGEVRAYVEPENTHKDPIVEDVNEVAMPEHDMTFVGDNLWAFITSGTQNNLKVYNSYKIQKSF